MRLAFGLGLTRLALLGLAAFGPAAMVQAATTAASTAVAAHGDAATTQGKPRQFLYVLRLVPRLHDDQAWTEADGAATERHFAHLKRATAEGRVILAGRTLEPGDKTFGLVIFEAPDEATAREFMESDPAVVAGVMTATLHPYTVALQRE